MTDQERKVWLKALLEDLAHLSDAQLAYGCARYRRDPENRFFPSPGQLLAACKSPFDFPRGKIYAQLEELPPPMDSERAEQVIRETYRKLRYFPDIEQKSVFMTKEEILARPPIVSIPMTPEQKNELLTNLDKRIQNGNPG